MPKTSDLKDMRFSALWKQMSPERRMAAARAFWDDRDSTKQQAEAVACIARHRKFRAKTIQRLTVEQKARYLASIPDIPDEIVARVLVAYHLNCHRAMLKAFLDRLEIANDEGLIAGSVANPPEAGRLAAASQELASRFPADDVSLYLSTLVVQDPDIWGGLAVLPETAGAGREMR